MSEIKEIKKTKLYFAIIIFFIGFLHVYLTKNAIDPDGVSYLDIGDAYFSGCLYDAINPYWSPLFSLIQGFFALLFNPSIEFEPLFVHLVNFGIYIFSYLMFLYFLDSVIEITTLRQKKIDSKINFMLDELLLVIFGNALFLWVSVNMITLSRLTPDLLVSGFLYLLFGCLVRFKLGYQNIVLFMIFGLTLGLGYLAKAFMFPLAFLFLVTAYCILPFNKINSLKLFIAFLVFIFVASPFIYQISKKQGEFTFGQSGKMNWAWYLNKSYEYWREGWPGNQDIVHPARKVYDTPSAYEYSEPVKGTYPFWYEPAYWFTGLKPYFSLKSQVGIIFWALSRHFKVLIEMQNILVFLFILSTLMLNKKKDFVSDLTQNWFLLVIPGAVTITYALVATELRYLAPFNLVAWIAIFSSIKFPNSELNKKLISTAFVLIAMFFVAGSSISYDLLTNGKNDSALTQIKVAKQIKNLGLQNDDKVAVIGLDYGIYWARLAHVRIIGEVSTEEESVLWFSSKDVRNNIFNSFKRFGAKLVVMENPPKQSLEADWINVKDTSYYIKILKS